MLSGFVNVSLDIYRSQSVHIPTYAEVKKSFEVLNFIHSNHIHSLDDMKSYLSVANLKEDIAMHKYFSLANKKEQLKTLNFFGDEYARLLKTEMKDKLRNDLSQLDSLAAEMGRASKERTNAEMSLAYLEDFLKSDYNRIWEHEQLCIQIENYHNELEPQEDGTYKCVWQSRSLSPMTSQRVKAKIKK